MINWINNKKVHYFIEQNVNQELINSCEKDIEIIRIFNSTIDTNIKFPENITIIILEFCKIDLLNLDNYVKEIWLINSRNQTNLPIGLEKLKIYDNFGNKMKIPYDCVLELVK